MSKSLRVLAFDERNQRDFEDMTDRIRRGLDTIRTNRRLEPTQETLARLAACSRRTLSLRKWPIQQLNQIKDERHAKKKDSGQKTPANTKNSEDQENRLIRQIRSYQQQNGRLFDQLEDLKEGRSKDALVIAALEEQVTALTQDVYRLEKQIRIAKFGVVRKLNKKVHQATSAS